MKGGVAMTPLRVCILGIQTDDGHKEAEAAFAVWATIKSAACRSTHVGGKIL